MEEEKYKDELSRTPAMDLKARSDSGEAMITPRMAPLRQRGLRVGQSVSGSNV